MNQIKFRGKSLATREWVCGYYYAMPQTFHNKTELSHAIVDEKGHIYIVDPKTVGQYVGCLDEEENEVYEHDILRAHEHIDIVVWRDDLCGFSYKNDKSRLNLVEWLEHARYSGTFIIGNIHDTPELLNQE